MSSASQEQMEMVASALNEAPAGADLRDTFTWLRENRPAAFQTLGSFTRDDLCAMRQMLLERGAQVELAFFLQHARVH